MREREGEERRERMEAGMGRGGAGGPRRSLSLKARLGLKAMSGCCGSPWRLRSASSRLLFEYRTAREEGRRPAEEEEDGRDPRRGGTDLAFLLSQIPPHEEAEVGAPRNPRRGPPNLAYLLRSQSAAEEATASAEEMNLAMALAAERRLRAAEEEERAAEEAGETPLRVSLMRLLEEGAERERAEREGEAEGEGKGWWCCVCMHGGRKGAAFIPCGHTFCRVCARELWLKRGSCPLCNRPILEILDIY